MSRQAFEIRCPACGSVVPLDSSGCPNCAKKTQPRGGAAAADNGTAALDSTASEVVNMRIKDYHRFVRANYRTVEGPAAAGYAGGGFRVRAYLPFVLLLIGILIGAAMASGRL